MRRLFGRRKSSKTYQPGSKYALAYKTFYAGQRRRLAQRNKGLMSRIRRGRRGTFGGKMRRR